MTMNKFTMTNATSGQDHMLHAIGFTKEVKPGETTYKYFNRNDNVKKYMYIQVLLTVMTTERNIYISARSHFVSSS